MIDTPDVSWIQVAVAFATVLGLMAGLGFILKFFSLRGWNMAGVRRTRRLEIVESLPIDPRRRLVIARCDGREHLLLLGAERDIVVDTNLPTPPDDSGDLSDEL